jgi:transcriptional regulator
MTMYTPTAFSSSDRAAAARLVAEHPFATLVTTCDGEPAVTHLPLLLVPDREPFGTLIGHLARANDHWRHFAEGRTLAIFQGPQHYVSPAWYTHAEGSVPTWNYAVVHLSGHPEIVADASEIDTILDATVRHFESHHEPAWTPQLTADALRALREAIVAFRIPVQHVEAKFKLSQNRPIADRKRVAQMLGRSESREARDLAEWMKRLGVV